MLPPPGSFRDAQLKRPPSFTTKCKTFVVGQIFDKIYDGDLSNACYRRYLKEEEANDTNNPRSMY
jgi:hypothetical protein